MWKSQYKYKISSTEYEVNIGTEASKYIKQTPPPWPLVRERTIATERPPLIDEIVSTFVDRGVSRGQRGGSPTVVNLSFLDRKIHKAR
jgi:hypothetical protein